MPYYPLYDDPALIIMFLLLNLDLLIVSKNNPGCFKSSSGGVDIIHYLEDLTNKLLYFALSTEFVLAKFF
jgi:hypothetical protein